MFVGITGNISSGKDTLAKIMLMYLSNKNLNVNFIPKDINDYLENYFELCCFETNSGWQIKKFAFKLKQIAAILVGCEASDFENEDFKNKPLDDIWQLPHQLIKYSSGVDNRRTNRWLLQQLGTEAIRNNIHKETWVNALFCDLQQNSNWLITDVRFLNEAKSIKDRSGIIIKIIRGEQKIEIHQSETELNSIKQDFTIYNNGTLEELCESAKTFLEKYSLI